MNNKRSGPNRPYLNGELTGVDLHVHSSFSDGTMTPQALLQSALEEGVGILAIADHNMLEGARLAMAESVVCGIKVISGVELDALEGHHNIHILGYGCDLSSEDFNAFVIQNRRYLDEVSHCLIEKMTLDHPVSLASYEHFQYDSSLGGWKALHYFMAMGITQSLYEGMLLYEQYGCQYDCVPFPTVSQVCEAIHSAGGVAVLAHPGVTYRGDDMKAFLEHMIVKGVDGIECYYPKHDSALTQLCLDIARQHELLITVGSDCHGGFGNTKVGQMGITTEHINLGPLMD